MYQLLRTYLIGENKKFELYGDVDAGDKVTKVLSYESKAVNAEENFSHWVCMGEVDISEYTQRDLNPAMAYQFQSKNNDIYSIRELCKQIAEK
ncbi:hypothetical protein ABEH22_22765 [Pantoea agglomerans]|uniref:hypothetical protein n=1 Tax=Enterobacter agglomerans TaxID=549 RepID=UPI00289819BD|nr:hypothetical protein [Pantoea agglomerans]WNK36836.1 hypothetical protein RM158_08475 [Pantoea agglomerans]